jgi:dihydrofolate synthase/folylpolyglutamate synthase
LRVPTGKGSVAKTIETLLLASGRKTGLFTSPHLIDATERIRVAGRNLTQTEFIESYEAVKTYVRSENFGRFETFVLMMAYAFWSRAQVDHAVIEVGVGGRIDPTRGIPHATSVITQLGFDHQELLGGSISAIAVEKWQIVEPGNLVVYAPTPVEALAVVNERQKEIAAHYTEARSFSYHVDQSAECPVWVIETPWGEAPLSLMGARAIANASVALRVIEGLGLEPRQLLPYLSNVQWPGRMEGFQINGKMVFLSGDHNPQGVESLREIVEHFKYDRLHLIVGIGQNKPACEMLDRFAELPRSTLYLTPTPFRSMTREAYLQWRSDAVIAENPMAALQDALRVSLANDLIIVSGSLYLIGEVRKLILLGRLGRVFHEREWTNAVT